jgi:peptide/nickel transport system permease protein
LKRYILKRIIILPLVLFVLSVLIFSLTAFLSPSARAAVFVTNPEDLQNVDIEQLIERYGLDEPFYIQYVNWAKGAATGELGWSVSHRMPVADVLKQRIPATIELMVLAQIIIFASTIILGTLAAKYHKLWPDTLVRLAVTTGISIPNFVIGIFLLIVFYAGFNILPPGRLSLAATDIVYSSGYTTYTGMHMIDSLLNGEFFVFWDALKHVILPSIAYASGPVSASTRLMRSSILENMKRGYANTARVKGLPENKVITRHVRRNALIPTITYIGMEVPVLLGGSVIIETIFNYPGMGMFIVSAAKGLDFAAIIGASLAICLIIMVSNLLVDLLYGVLNPQLRQEYEE